MAIRHNRGCYALVLLGLSDSRRRRIVETLFGVNDSHENGLELSSGHSNSQSIIHTTCNEAASDTDSGLSGDSREAEIYPVTVSSHVVQSKRNLMLRASDSWLVGNATPKPSSSETSMDSQIETSLRAESFDNLSQIMYCRSESDFSPESSDTLSEDDEDAKLAHVYPISHDREEDTEEQEYVPVENQSQEAEGSNSEKTTFLNRLTQSPFRLREGGSHMLNVEKYCKVQTACLKVQRVVGHGSKQVLLEETNTIAGIKIVDIIPSLTNIRSIVKDGKVIIQGTVHKQIFYIGTDGLEHHLAEDIDFSELVDVEPLNPMYPVREGMNQQDFSVIENSVFEFDPDTGALTQKIILRLCVKVTETDQLAVGVSPQGTLIKAAVVVGEGTKQKFIEETKIIPAIKVIEIIPRISQIRHIVKNGKVLVQGIVHKQIFYVGTDDLVHHLSEDIPFSDLVIVPCACEGMNSQDHSFVDNLVFEFDPATGSLTQKIILALCVKVTETCGVPVITNQQGTLISANQIIGMGCAQKLVEETKTLPAIKIVDIDARISEITSIVKNGKVIVQGTVHKQIFYVGTDDLVHHLAEDLPFSEMIEIPPINPEFPVEEGMDQQDHSFVENIVWEFDPTTGELTEKVIIGIQVVVTSHVQIPVVVSGGCPGNDLWLNQEDCPDNTHE